MNNHPSHERIAALVGTRAHTSLASGRSVTVVADDDGERVEVRGRSGALEITLELTPTGAKLHVEAVDISLRAAKTLRAECDHLELRARVSASVQSPETVVESTAGDLVLRAHDDVRAAGERVLLNCDDDERVPDWMAERLGAALRAPGT